MTAGVPVDSHLREHLGWGDQPPAGAVLHSTSWRHDPDNGALILTWAIAPDLHPNGNQHPVPATAIVQGTDGAHPTPATLTANSIANHAARHLAYLLHTDPLVDASLHQHPAIHDALIRHHPAVAGNPHR